MFYSHDGSVGRNQHIGILYWSRIILGKKVNDHVLANQSATKKARSGGILEG